MTIAVSVGVNAPAKDTREAGLQIPAGVPAPTGPQTSVAAAPCRGVGRKAVVPVLLGEGDAGTTTALLAAVVAERWAPDPWRTLHAQAVEIERTARDAKWRRTVAFWEQPLRGRKRAS